MPRVAIRLGSLVAALTFAVAGLAVGASAASATGATEQQAVSNAMHAQLARAPGGTVRGDSIVYGADHVTVKYIPKTARATRVALADLCDPTFLCLYKYTGWGTQVLETSSHWCPHEGSSHLYLSHYGLWGQIQSAISNVGWWSRMYWEDGWGFFGAQWTLQPFGAISQASDTNNDWIEVCTTENDLDPSATG